MTGGGSDERAWEAVAAQVAQRNREAVVIDAPTGDRLRQLLKHLRDHRPDLFEEDDSEDDQR